MSYPPQGSITRAELNIVEADLSTHITDYDALIVALELFLKAETAGKKLAWGKTAVIGTQDVSTGLATVLYAVGILRSDVSLDGSWVSILDNSNGSIAISVWKPTSSVDNTPIPNTAGKTVTWFAIGT